MTRWSRVTTQSETYSSIPNRVRLPSLPRSPVITTVRSRSLSHRNRRPSSPRMMASFGSALNSSSIVSSTTRLAPTDSTAIWSRMNSPSRSKEPVSTISAGSNRKASIASRPSRSSCSRSKPSDATLVTRSSCASSKASITPGSPKSRAPRTRNSMPNMVFPEPAAPATRVGRPRGRPPLVISSKPMMPVGAFSRPARTPALSAPGSTLVVITHPVHHCSLYCNTSFFASSRRFSTALRGIWVGLMRMSIQERQFSLKGSARAARPPSLEGR